MEPWKYTRLHSPRGSAPLENGVLITTHHLKSGEAQLNKFKCSENRKKQRCYPPLYISLPLFLTLVSDSVHRLQEESPHLWSNQCHLIHYSRDSKTFKDSPNYSWDLVKYETNHFLNEISAQSKRPVDLGCRSCHMFSFMFKCRWFGAALFHPVLMNKSGAVLCCLNVPLHSLCSHPTCY